MSRTLSLPRPTVLLGFLLTGAMLAWSVMPARHIWHILHTLRLAPSHVSEFVLGAAVGAVAAVLLRRRQRITYLATFGHELAHMLVALVTFGRVHEFRVTAVAGGHVIHDSGWRLPVLIAPYSLPQLAIALVLVSAFSHGVGRPTAAMTIAIGCAIGLHVAVAAGDVQDNVRQPESDFTRYGPTRTLAWVWITNVVLLSTILSFCISGRNGVVELWGEVWATQTAIVRYMLHWIVFPLR